MITVKELKKILETMPDDSEIAYSDGQDWYPISNVWFEEYNRYAKDEWDYAVWHDKKFNKVMFG